MILLDFCGLLLSAVVLGPFYSLYVVLIALLQELIRVFVILILEGGIQHVFVGGIFGNTFAILNNNAQYMMVALIGPVICSLFGILKGGLRLKDKKQLFNPLAKLSYPLGVVSLRLGLLSIFLSSCQLVKQGLII